MSGGGAGPTGEGEASATAPPVPVAVIVPTLDEEAQLGDALDGVVGWAAEVYVVDSLSTDRTVDLALERGVTVVQRPFTNFGDHWNWAIEELPIESPWILKLDADERVTPELREEIARVLASDPPRNGFELRRRLWFMGRPMTVERLDMRLWRRGHARFSDVPVNEHVVVEGATGVLSTALEHLDSTDLHRWCEKQNRYTTLEALVRVRGDALAAAPRLLGTPLERKMWIKRHLPRVPFRFAMLWLFQVVVRGAWRSGWPGLTWAHLRVEVYRMRELKAREMTLRGLHYEPPPRVRGALDPRVAATDLQQRLMTSPRWDPAAVLDRDGTGGAGPAAPIDTDGADPVAPGRP